jgi:hypothetical protein
MLLALPCTCSLLVNMKTPKCLNNKVQKVCTHVYACHVIGRFVFVSQRRIKYKEKKEIQTLGWAGTTKIPGLRPDKYCLTSSLVQ